MQNEKNKSHFIDQQGDTLSDGRSIACFDFSI